MLSDILGPEVVHHAAGGYPKIMNAEGIAAMIGDFLAAFPDLLITFDQFIAKDDFVVERYTASGTHQGPLGDCDIPALSWYADEVATNPPTVRPLGPA